MITKIKDTYKNYLISKLPDRLKSLFAQSITGSNTGSKGLTIYLDIPDDIADDIRNWALDQLQVSGFDFKYDLTEDGKILEDIIDIFFTG